MGECPSEFAGEFVVAMPFRKPRRPENGDTRAVKFETLETVQEFKNLARTYQACQGEYVALLEGDDYWISPHKLLKQVDFLDVHPNFAICFHNALIVDEERHQEPRPFRRGDQKEISTLRDLISGNFIPTCSTVFRNKLIQEFPEWFYRLKMADRPLHILNAEHGDIYYLNEIMSVYRKHPEGIWTKSDYADHIVSRIPLYMEVNPYLDYKFDDVINSKLKELWERLAIVIIEREVQLGER